MKFLATLCLVGVALGSPRPGFRYAYMIPQTDEGQPLSQFNERSGDNYAWGYEYPGRVHYETKDGGGVVRGSFGFVDANGSPNVWKYQSNPGTGFVANVETGQVLPQAPALPPSAAVPVSYTADQKPSATSEDIQQPSSVQLRQETIFKSFSPLLKSAADSGDILSAGLSLSGTPQFAVNPDIADEVQSISALAHRFDAIPVAAVHDNRGRPTGGIPESAFSPVLIQQEQPEFTLYTLELPGPSHTF